MSYHILNIDSAGTTITCKDRRVVCIEADGVSRSIPMEDVASIVVTSFKTTLTNRVIVEAARSGVTIVVCDGFRPVSLLVPANRNSDTLLTRAHVRIHARQRALLWRKTIDAKVRNQWLLSRHWQENHRNAIALAAVQGINSRNKEALAARHHWRVFGHAIGETGFRRDFRADGVNALLNYGYGVLLSVVLQRMFAVGLDPTFGISHLPRAKATPLAYDLMEPFRPLVDAEVAECRKRLGSAAAAPANREARALIAQSIVKLVRHGDRVVECRIVIEDVLRSFRRAVMDRKPSLYQPWTPKDSRWAGCS